MNNVCFSGVYYITPNMGENGYQWLQTITQAVEGGASMVQIRDKKSSARCLIEAVKYIRPVLKQKAVPLIINDRADIAFAVDADGVHVGQNDVRIQTIRAIMGRKCIVGISLETPLQLQSASDADYVAASPLFVTHGKQDAGPPWGLEGLVWLRKATTLPIVAIGGINRINVSAVYKAGANMIAVMSAIAFAPCPKLAALELSQEGKRNF